MHTKHLTQWMEVKRSKKMLPFTSHTFLTTLLFLFTQQKKTLIAADSNNLTCINRKLSSFSILIETKNWGEDDKMSPFTEEDKKSRKTCEKQFDSSDVFTNLFLKLWLKCSQTKKKKKNMRYVLHVELKHQTKGNSSLFPGWRHLNCLLFHMIQMLFFLSMCKRSKNSYLHQAPLGKQFHQNN